MTTLEETIKQLLIDVRNGALITPKIQQIKDAFKGAGYVDGSTLLEASRLLSKQAQVLVDIATPIAVIHKPEIQGLPAAPREGREQ